MNGKRWLALVLSLMLVLSLALVPGCSGDDEANVEEPVVEEPAVEKEPAVEFRVSWVRPRPHERRRGSLQRPAGRRHELPDRVRSWC